jgi:general secretion pathway protein K
MNTVKQGSALILALWTLFMLAALAVAVATQVSAVLRLAGGLRSGQTARALAVAGAETAIADLVAGSPDITNNPSRFKDAAVLDGGSFSVYYASDNGGSTVTNFGLGPESRKLNLNRAGTLEIAVLLKERGLLSASAASAAADAIVDWRDRDSIPLTGGAEDQYYGSLTIPYPCRDSDMTVVEELLLVKGVTGDVLIRVRPFVTVLSGECFGGTSVGYAIAGGVTAAVARVDFAVDRAGRKCFWYEQ